MEPYSFRNGSPRFVFSKLVKMGVQIKEVEDLHGKKLPSQKTMNLLVSLYIVGRRMRATTTPSSRIGR